MSEASRVAVGKVILGLFTPSYGQFSFTKLWREPGNRGEVSWMEPLKPLFCTVIEPTENWVNAAALLMHSLRRNGGEHAKSPFVVLVNGVARAPSPLLDDENRRLLILGNDRHPLIPHISKVSSLGLADLLPFTHLILLDHDTIVLRLDDLTTFLTDKVHARRNYKYGLVRFLGKDYAKALVAPGVRPWSRIHYFNSGVVFVPRKHCLSLEKHWRSWAELLIEPYHGRPLAEQMGFAMALASARIPYAFLPGRYNETNWRPPSSDPAIIHYNAHDPINKEVKSKALASYEDLRAFLQHTDNRFWRAHAPTITRLMGPELDALAARMSIALRAS